MTIGRQISRMTLAQAWLVTALSCASILVTSDLHAQGLVKVTPLGSHDGELCVEDRAIVFEDPTGVRILYDPGRGVDETDPRLGDIDVMLLSHAHVDHIGERRPGRGGSCAAPAQGAANPSSNFASIAAAKRAASFFVSSELDVFFGAKIQGITGTPTPLCVPRNRDDETVVPRPAACTARIHPGGSLVVRRSGAGTGVRIAAVQAVHPNGIPAAVIDAPGSAPGMSGYGGIAGGYILRFTNGLSVYLTGDTGLFADMEIIGRFYRPGMMVINIGDVGTLGPTEAAYVIQNLIRTTTVMPSHAYEQSTSGGVVLPNSRFARFASLVRGLVEIVAPLSGVTRTFDSEGRCVGCR
jgi:L-ascorbate metabolism protein UlaG (beta-lactamase superfamily)